MLAAFRRNRQIADILKLPHCVRLADGTFDRFVDGFLAIDTAKLGTFSFDELCMHMGIHPKELITEEEEEEGEEGEWEDEEEGDGGDNGEGGGHVEGGGNG